MSCPRQDRAAVLDMTVGPEDFFRGCEAAHCPVDRIVKDDNFPAGCTLLLHAIRWGREEKANV